MNSGIYCSLQACQLPTTWLGQLGNQPQRDVAIADFADRPGQLARGLEQELRRYLGFDYPKEAIQRREAFDSDAKAMNRLLIGGGDNCAQIPVDGREQPAAILVQTIHSQYSGMYFISAAD
jgi:hypothetical protein